MDFHALVDLAAMGIEAAGVCAMIGGAVVALVLALGVGGKSGGGAAFRAFRRNLGHAILLGLEFLVAADIIRTVNEVPSLEKVVVLAIIVLIRTFLSFTLQLEIEGRWPWQPRLPSDERPAPGDPVAPSGP
jgi:uncharacterized membrane protein